MVRVSDVFAALEELAPVETKMDFDNVGLLVGRAEGDASKILISLDITDAVIEEAKRMGAGLIVSHHPLFFDLKSVTDETPQGRRILALAEAGISAICMHTNLDAAEGGVNDALTAVLGLEKPQPITMDGTFRGKPYGTGRYGTLPEETALPDFLAFVREKLGANGLRYCDAGRKVKTVGVVGGSGGDWLEKAAALGCDTFVTADVKYHVFLLAKELDINLIDAGHYNTENTVTPVLQTYLAARFPEAEVLLTAVHRQTEQYYR